MHQAVSPIGGMAKQMLLARLRFAMSATPPKPGQTSGSHGDEGEIVQCILEYLKAQPQSADTLEGIAKWWLMRQRVSEATALVQQTLDHLKSEGLIHERRLPGGSTLYAASDPRKGRAGKT